MIRIIASLLPPGANGSTTRTGLVGYAGAEPVEGVCAAAFPLSKSSIIAACAEAKINRSVICFSVRRLNRQSVVNERFIR
jgi:hypothetical protein